MPLREISLLAEILIQFVIVQSAVMTY